MNHDLEKELADASGESHYRGPRSLELNELSINGDGDVTEVAPGQYQPKGGYFRKRLMLTRKQNEKPEEVNLGPTVKVILLRKRRKLVERGEKGKIMRSTNEHNTKKDVVTLYESESKRSVDGVAEDLRLKYDQLRTVEVFYSLLLSETAEPELVRLTIKGASLGSESKQDTVNTIYSYMSSFPGSEHMWQFETNLVAVREQGAKSYYAIDFKKGERLEEQTITNVVAPALRKLRDNFAELDKARAQRVVETQKSNDDFDLPEKTQPDNGDDINPDDIPFS